MLCQFAVTNYCSIKNEAVLDMQATTITENKETLLTDVDGERFLPISVIYGPNGAGKSTVLQAIVSLLTKVMRPICAISCADKICMKKENRIMIKPFKFAKETVLMPTSYELFFRTKSYEYQYKLNILRDSILFEELYKKKLVGSRYSLVFSREKNKKIDLKGSLRGYRCADISPTLPLLSYLGITHKRNAIIKDVINWFDNEINFIDYANPFVESRVGIPRDKYLKKLMLGMLSEMGIDVVDYRVEKKTTEDDNALKIFTQHNVDDIKYELELDEESSGTIKMLGILPAIAESLVKGKTLIVDELDAKLHPLLLKYIIALYNNPKINMQKAQLIFTSHDLSTMNSENFRRDEIWFVAKGIDESSKLYSLVEFKDETGKTIRKDEVYDKNYLKGKYGADPYFQKIIKWGEE